MLEVSLRKAGFSVTPAVSVGDALDKLEINAPDLIISETKFATELDGFELRRRLRAAPVWAEIPFIFLTAETAIENKIKGLELGVDDYLTKPIYIKEIITRINILLQKKQRQFLDAKKDGTRFAGRVSDMPVVDVIQTIEISRKSGVIQFTGGPSRNATIYFRDGKVIDAEAGTLQGEDAVYRLLTWNDGDFEVEFRTVRRREAIQMSSQGLLMEGMRRLDEWSRLLEQLPPLAHRFEIDAGELSVRLGEIPDDNNRILRLFDGKRTLIEVIDSSDFGDLECLQAISRLYFEGMLTDLDPDQQRARRETGKPVPMTLLHEDSAPTPIEEVASGPIDMARLQGRPSRPDINEFPRARRESGELVSNQEVIFEEPQEKIREPLQGAYRPSSLRLIDEAVAAAQLIEPSLFDADELAAAGVTPAPAVSQEVPPPSESPPAAETPIARVQLTQVEVEARPNGARRQTTPPPIPQTSKKQNDDDVPLMEAEAYTSGEIRLPTEADLADAPMLDIDPDVSGEHRPIPPPPPKKAEQVTADDIVEREDYSGVPTVIEAEAPRSDDITDEGPTDPSRRRFAATAEREGSQGVRMIGSHGQDRAEAAGELAEGPTAPPPETAPPPREMVTIMPRKSTRELPTIDPAKVDAKSDTRVDAKTDARVDAKPAVEPPPSRMSPPPRRVSVEGGVVKATTGPGRGALALLTIGAVLVGATVFSYCRKKTPSAPVVTTAREDAAVVAIKEIADATEYFGFGFDAATGAVPTTQPDAAVIAMRPDAAVRPDAAEQIVTTRPDAAVRADAAGQVATSTADAAVDKAKEARALYNKGHAALEDGDPEAALELLDKSLAVKRAQRTYLEKARALQRMSKIDDALAAIDQAMKMGQGYAPAWEQKGMLLWSAQRYGEARPVLEHYLELDPTGKKADTIRSMLEENK